MFYASPMRSTSGESDESPFLLEDLREIQRGPAIYYISDCRHERVPEPWRVLEEGPLRPPSRARRA